MAARRAIRRLGLSHFRSHLGLTLQADGRPVALFGPNGAGKTNILEALSMLSPGRGLRRAGLDEMARAPGTVGWKVAARIGEDGDLREVETWVDPAQGPSRQVRIDGKAETQAALGRVLRMVWLTPAMDRLWTEGAGERRRFLDRVALSFDPGHAEASLAYEKAMRERNRLLKDQARDPSWYAALEAEMARAGAAIARARAEAVARLAAAAEGAETAFPRADLSLDGPLEIRFAEVIAAGDAPKGEEPAAASLLAHTLGAGRARDLAAGRTLEGPHRTDLSAIFVAKGVEARLCSTGEQKALLISLVLANARALAAEGPPPVLLLDEVAAHLDESRRAALYDEIVALGAQAWMTGTGPELFEALGPRAQRFEVREAGGVSVVTQED